MHFKNHQRHQEGSIHNLKLHDSFGKDVLLANENVTACLELTRDDGHVCLTGVERRTILEAPDMDYGTKRVEMCICTLVVLKTNISLQTLNYQVLGANDGENVCFTGAEAKDSSNMKGK